MTTHPIPAAALAQREEARVLTLARDVYAGDEDMGILESIKWASVDPQVAESCCRIFKAAFIENECSLQNRAAIATIFDRAIEAAGNQS